MSDVTQILNAIEQGNSRAADELLPLVYEELRLLAAQKLSQERPDQTLQATALVHEAYIRLVGEEVQDWKNRHHFFRAAAEAMRRIIIDNVRALAGTGGVGTGYIEPWDCMVIIRFAMTAVLKALPAHKPHKASCEVDRKAQCGNAACWV